MKNFSLTRNERVKKKRDFEKVYSSAKVLFSSDRLIKVHFLCVDSNLSGVKIAAAVSKKVGNAVWRNRVKRLVKETYRLNKTPLLEKVLNKNIEDIETKEEFLRVLYLLHPLLLPQELFAHLLRISLTHTHPQKYFYLIYFQYQFLLSEIC